MERAVNDRICRQMSGKMVIFAYSSLIMRFGYSGILLGAILGLGGCASSKSAVSGRAATDYNDYNEDLSSVRPVYRPVATSSANRPAAPASTSPALPAAPRRAESRKSSEPAEALHVNRRLDSVMDTIATQNRSIRYAPGYRVQVYIGNQRQEVESIKLLIYQNFPELSAYLSYNQPTYKLKVGDFMRRLDAERYHASIRQLIKSAQLQPDKVDIRRSLLIK